MKRIIGVTGVLLALGAVATAALTSGSRTTVKPPKPTVEVRTETIRQTVHRVRRESAPQPVASTPVRRRSTVVRATATAPLPQRPAPAPSSAPRIVAPGPPRARPPAAPRPRVEHTHGLDAQKEQLDRAKEGASEQQQHAIDQRKDAIDRQKEAQPGD
jgi:hypothetical protein